MRATEHKALILTETEMRALFAFLSMDVPEPGLTPQERFLVKPEGRATLEALRLRIGAELERKPLPDVQPSA